MDWAGNYAQMLGAVAQKSPSRPLNRAVSGSRRHLRPAMELQRSSPAGPGRWPLLGAFRAWARPARRRRRRQLQGVLWTAAREGLRWWCRAWRGLLRLPRQPFRLRRRPELRGWLLKLWRWACGLARAERLALEQLVAARLYARARHEEMQWRCGRQALDAWKTRASWGHVGWHGPGVSDDALFKDVTRLYLMLHADHEAYGSLQRQHGRPGTSRHTPRTWSAAP